MIISEKMNGFAPRENSFKLKLPLLRRIINFVVLSPKYRKTEVNIPNESKTLINKSDGHLVPI